MTLPVATGKANNTATKDDHPAHHNALAEAVNDDLLRADLAPVTPSRAFGTAFQPFPADRPGWVSYTCQISLDLVLLGSRNRTIELRSDASDPPTTVRTQMHVTGPNLVDNLGLETMVFRNQLSYLVPEGHYVLLVNSGTTGSSASIVNQVETEL